MLEKTEGLASLEIFEMESMRKSGTTGLYGIMSMLSVTEKRLKQAEENI